MAKESKGKVVKTFKHYIPVNATEKAETIVKVYFEAKNGWFVIYLPDQLKVNLGDRHLAEGDLYNPPRQAAEGFEGREGFVRSLQMDRAISLFEQVCREFERIQKLENREKIIVVTFNANHPQKGGFDGGGPGYGKISFIGRPALHLSYRVFWKVGVATYTDDGNGGMTHHGTVPKSDGVGGTYVLEWTPEREAFFAQAVNGIAGLIDRIADFLSGDTALKVDALVSGGVAFLPAPKED